MTAKALWTLFSSRLTRRVSRCRVAVVDVLFGATRCKATRGAGDRLVVLLVVVVGDNVGAFRARVG